VKLSNDSHQFTPDNILSSCRWSY